jgi:DNA polymerase
MAAFPPGLLTEHLMTPERTPTPRELLAFYLEAGVDCALSEESIDRLAEEAVSEERVAPVNTAPRPLLRSSGTSPSPANSFARQGMFSEDTLPRGDAAPAPDVAVSSAREAARTAATLDELRGLLQAFDGCALKFTATQLVFADGNPQARIMFVGEAPGRDEDLEGRPFVGRSGKLLDLMIGAIGLNRSNVYIANVIPWRPPGNRTPTPQETQICLPFIQRQIELVNPDIVVTMGNPSTQTLLKTRDGIMKTRGKWINYDTGTRTVRAMPTFHPAYLLRSPSYKRLAWQDFRAIKKALADTI